MNDDVTHAKLVDVVARSDAAIDGRPFDGMARADRQRYSERAAKSVEAVAQHVAMFPRDLLSEMTARKKGPAFSEEAFDTFLAMAETFDVSRPAPVQISTGVERF